MGNEEINEAGNSINIKITATSISSIKQNDNCIRNIQIK